MKGEKLIPDKKLYYILSSIGLILSIISISLLFSLEIFWLNIGLSIACIIYTFIFIIIFLKKETKEKNNILGILGWLVLILAVAFLGTALFIGSVDDTNSLSVLKVLFISIDILPGFYLIVKIIVLLVTTPGWW